MSDWAPIKYCDNEIANAIYSLAEAVSRNTAATGEAIRLHGLRTLEASKILAEAVGDVASSIDGTVDAIFGLAEAVDSISGIEKMLADDAKDDVDGEHEG